MASHQKYIVLEIDGRGSGGQGESLKTSVKGQLGFKEVRDQIAGVKYFLEKNSKIVDKNRVAVSGVSYGGYIAGMVLTEHDADMFLCGISVSPVVKWQFYGIYYNKNVSNK